MCLTTLTNKPNIAPCDIPIYKLAVYHNDAYYAPFRNTKIGKNPNKKIEIIEGGFHCMYTIHGGCIHAYTTSDKAETASEILLRLHNKRTKILYGYIPKGTEYFAAVFDKDICARKVKYYFLEQMSLIDKIKYKLKKNKLC